MARFRLNFGWGWPLVAILVMALFTLSPAFAEDGGAAKARLKARIDRQYAESKDAVVSGTAEQMYREYNANEVAADAKYKGKWVQVRGRLYSVVKGIKGDPYLALAADGYGVTQVHAVLFDVQVKALVGDSGFSVCSAAEKAAPLRRGQSVTVECLGRGSLVGVPRLEQCLIIDGAVR